MWHTANMSGAERVFCGGGVVCRAVSGSHANIAIPTSEWPFLLNCLIVLAGQAGGSKSHLAFGEKKNKARTSIQCIKHVGGG